MLAHECLISKLVGDLSVRSPRDLATTLVLLPTKRLELNLAAHLTMAKSGTAVLPQTKSWNLFLSECIAPTKSKSLVMVSSLLELTMKDFLSNHTSTSGNEPNQISSEHAHELVHLMAELWRNNARHSAQLLIKEWLERLWHLSDEVKIDLDKRVERVFSSLNQFEAHLLASGYQTTEAQQAQAIESSLLTMQEICTRLPYKRIIIAGLTSLPKIEIMFLNQLVAEAPSQNISIESWIHQPWRDLSVHAPLRLLSQAKTDAESPKLNISRMIQCKDPVDEMAFAIDHAMSKIDAGMPPSQLIIAVPDESIYQSIARSLMSLLPVTANIPLAKDLNATNSGRWFAQLIDLLKLKSSESFVRLAKHQDWSRIFKLPVLNENQVRHETQLEYWLQFAPNTIGDLDKTSLKTLQNDQVKELILNFDRGFINEYFFNQNSQKLDWAELQTWWQKAIQEPVERFLNQTKKHCFFFLNKTFCQRSLNSLPLTSKIF
ncbi:MAG: hypothetical protein NT027_09170 [Proteobacteria bacterium]|nr:hypothetical protein [Pseudomonadota bacterium]